MKSKTNSVETPDYVLDALKKEFGNDLYDPCPFQPNFDPTKHKNGLTTEWGAINYCNPPFNDVKHWLMKAREEWLKGKTCIVLMKTTAGGTQYFKKCSPGAEIWFLTGKVKFKGYEHAYCFPIMLLVFRANVESNKFKCIKL